MPVELPAAVEVRHDDGRWYQGQLSRWRHDDRRGWLGSVEYSTGIGQRYSRMVPAADLRLPDGSTT